MRIVTINGAFTVCRLKSVEGVDFSAEYCFFAKTDEEMSLVCKTELVPETVEKREDGWAMFRIQGILDFSLTGVLARISETLANKNIGIFAISTYNTDYILVKKENMEESLAALQAAGYSL